MSKLKCGKLQRKWCEICKKTKTRKAATIIKDKSKRVKVEKTK